MHKDFKMSKQVKTMLALLKFKNEQDRSSFKRMMIDAQVSEERFRRDNSRGRGDSKDE